MKNTSRMRSLWLGLGGLLLAVILLAVVIIGYDTVRVPSVKAEGMPFLEQDQSLVTVNTTRIGSDDPVETAVAVAQMIYPVTE